MLDLQLWMSELDMGGHNSPPSRFLRFDIKADPACLKPDDAFWTSTALKRKDGYTSDWVQWVSNNQSDWLSSTGYLFRVKQKAKVLTMHTDEDALLIYQKFLGKEIPEHLDAIDRKYFIFKHFPWQLISCSYDGVHHCPPEGKPNLLRSWDCESTVWFDMNVLERIGKVKII